MSSVYNHFFDIMEDLGFFEHIYEELPEDFTAVFEIARILEDEDSPLTQTLRPVLKLRTAGGKRSEEAEAEQLQVFITDEEEYEAGLIRTPQHLPRIYNHQWLLPEQVFYHRLAKKELWVPYAREPRYYAVDPDADDYRPDGRKQKLYVLLDTSSSMAMRNRINLAKAVVYHFLKNNMKELGYIHFRTFDTNIGELHEARDSAGFRALISHVMRLHALGNGTAMARAITQAVRDINELPQLSGTEILIITDGACALNEAEIRELLGERIVINTIKIGKAQLYASRSYIRDRLFEDDTEQHRTLERLQKRQNELRYQLEHAQSAQLKRRYEESLQAIQSEIDRQINAMTEEITVGYGHELERLSEFFISLDDIDLPGLFSFRQEQLDDVRALFDEITAELDLHCSLEQLRKLALLMDHLNVLIKNTTDPELKKQFEALQEEVSRRLTGCIEAQIERSGGGVFRSLTAADRQDLEFLITSSSGLQLGLWRTFIWKLLGRLKKIVGSGKSA
jgi:hypothetical protein